MGKDRDDKFEGHEESEYHFSDEEMNYEMEDEASKQTATPSPLVGQKESVFTRLNRSKRMVISLVVFLVLVFIVYKMVTPTSTPTTDITTPPITTATQQTQSLAAKAPPPIPQPAAVPPQQAPGTPAVTMQVSSPAVTQSPPGTQPTQAQVANQAPVNVPPVAPGTVAALPPSGAQIAASATVPPQGMQPTQVISSQPPQVVNQAPIAPGAVGQQATQVISNMPAVIPVQPVVPNYAANTPVQVPELISAPGAGQIEQKSVALNADAVQVINQLQTSYAQKFNDFTNQNKALQDNVQALSNRVANVENELNQIIQLLSRQQGVVNNSAIIPVQAAESPKISYNVQAIIPGRAWLKSANGETLTVAEGDAIKGVGRVSKIDPYDGLVEINTGNRVVTLTYGNGG